MNLFAVFTLTVYDLFSPERGRKEEEKNSSLKEKIFLGEDVRMKTK